MMKLKMEDNSIINNVEFAAKNTIDGRLTIGISGIDLTNVYSIFSNQAILHRIDYLTDLDESIEVFLDYIVLSSFSVNPDANNMIFWMRKG